MKIQTCALGLLLSLATSAVAAEMNAADPLGESLFPPEFVMQHQSEIGLTDEQRQVLTSATRQAQDRFAALHEQLQKEVEALGTLLRNERVDVQAGRTSEIDFGTRDQIVKEVQTMSEPMKPVEPIKPAR